MQRTVRRGKRPSTASGKHPFAARRSIPGKKNTLNTTGGGIQAKKIVNLCQNPFCKAPLTNSVAKFCENNVVCQLYRGLRMHCALLPDINKEDDGGNVNKTGESIAVMDDDHTFFIPRKKVPPPPSTAASVMDGHEETTLQAEAKDSHNRAKVKKKKRAAKATRRREYDGEEEHAEDADEEESAEQESRRAGAKRSAMSKERSTLTDDQWQRETEIVEECNGDGLSVEEELRSETTSKRPPPSSTTPIAVIESKKQRLKRHGSADDIIGRASAPSTSATLPRATKSARFMPKAGIDLVPLGAANAQKAIGGRYIQNGNRTAAHSKDMANFRAIRTPTHGTKFPPASVIGHHSAAPPPVPSSNGGSSANAAPKTSSLPSNSRQPAAFTSTSTPAVAPTTQRTDGNGPNSSNIIGTDVGPTTVQARTVSPSTSPVPGPTPIPNYAPPPLPSTAPVASIKPSMTGISMSDYLRSRKTAEVTEPPMESAQSSVPPRQHVALSPNRSPSNDYLLPPSVNDASRRDKYRTNYSDTTDTLRSNSNRDAFESSRYDDRSYYDYEEPRREDTWRYSEPYAREFRAGQSSVPIPSASSEARHSLHYPTERDFYPPLPASGNRGYSWESSTNGWPTPFASESSWRDEPRRDNSQSTSYTTYGGSSGGGIIPSNQERTTNNHDYPDILPPTFSSHDSFLREVLCRFISFLPDSIHAIWNKTKKPRKLRFYLDYIKRVEDVCDQHVKVNIAQGKGVVMVGGREWLVMENPSSVNLYKMILEELHSQSMAWKKLMEDAYRVHSAAKQRKGDSVKPGILFVRMWNGMKNAGLPISRQETYFHGAQRHHFSFCVGNVEIGSGSHVSKREAYSLAAEDSMAFLLSLKLLPQRLKYSSRDAASGRREEDAQSSGSDHQIYVREEVVNPIRVRRSSSPDIRPSRAITHPDGSTVPVQERHESQNNENTTFSSAVQSGQSGTREEMSETENGVNGADVTVAQSSSTTAATKDHCMMCDMIRLRKSDAKRSLRCLRCQNTKQTPVIVDTAASNVSMKAVIPQNG